MGDREFRAKVRLAVVELDLLSLMQKLDAAGWNWKLKSQFRFGRRAYKARVTPVMPQDMKSHGYQYGVIAELHDSPADALVEALILTLFWLRQEGFTVKLPSLEVVPPAQEVTENVRE